MNPKLPQFTIYCATCLVNEKKYIGKTSQAVWTRWAKHLVDSKRGRTDFHSDLAKYGDEAFKLEILEVCLSQSEMDVRELWWMMEKKTMYPFGYNHYLGDNVIANPETRARQLHALRNNNPQTVEVIAIKDGKILNFPSISAFCKTVGVSIDTVRRMKKRGSSNINGYNYTERRGSCQQQQ